MGWREQVGLVQRTSIGAFAERAGTFTYEPDGLAPFAIQAIVRASHAEVDLEMEASVHTTQPELHVRREDLPAAPTSRDHVTCVTGIPELGWAVGQRFLIQDPAEDGEGMVAFSLRKVATP